MLELIDLHKSYGPVMALDGASFSVRRGQLLGFLGPNGAGKTTAMRAIFGLVRPSAGEMRWEGVPVSTQTRLRFGYMPEQRGLYPRMRVRSQLSYFGRLHGMPKQAAVAATDHWLERLDLAGRAESRLEELSHGNQQRVQLAAALVHDPELLVLDEPFSGLDPLGVQSMSEILAERASAGAAVVFSSHQLDLVEDICEDVVIIDRGVIVLNGPVRELRADSPLRYLEVELRSGDVSWIGGLLGVQVLSRTGARVKLVVGEGADLDRILIAARGAGELVEFSFQPPSLSEVFREAVAR